MWYKQALLFGYLRSGIVHFHFFSCTISTTAIVATKNCLFSDRVCSRRRRNFLNDIQYLHRYYFSQNVPWWLNFVDCPDNVTLSRPTNSILPPNSMVTCQSNVYPVPTYYEPSAVELGDNWTMLTVTNSSSLTLCKEGAYSVTCKATNYITSAQQGGFTCTGESVVYVYTVSSSGLSVCLCFIRRKLVRVATAK
jgi:hypothetical protein